MENMDCTAFLQWALPKAGFKWSGFRKVRRQVCRRLKRRMTALGLEGFAAYRSHLEAHAEEWKRFDGQCRITISRFFRDLGVFETLAAEVLPVLARRARDEGRPLRAWSAGAASGEEAYSLTILWRLRLVHDWPDIALEVTASDSDPAMLARAAAARYQAGSLKDVDDAWRSRAFVMDEEDWRLRPEFSEDVSFLLQDIRDGHLPGPFDLVLCRNLAFTYFDGVLQKGVLARIAEVVPPGGALVLGAHEELPPGQTAFAPWPGGAHIWQRTNGP